MRLRSAPAEYLPAQREKLQRAVELSLVNSTQPQLDAANSNAVSKLLNAIEGLESVVVQIGSLLLVKDKGAVAVKILSARQIAALSDTPGLLKAPEDLVQHLEQLDDTNH